MSDASLIALFSLGMASTLTVLFLAFRRRLDRMLRLSQQ